MVGRDPTCGLVLRDDRVSRKHALLSSTDEGWVLEDLGSKNGTSLDGMAVRVERKLEGSAWLSFGGVVAHFEPLSEEQAQAFAENHFERWQTSLALQRSLNPALGLEELLRRVLQSVLTLSGAERGFVMLARSSGELEVLAAEGIASSEVESREFSGSWSAIERVLEHGISVAISDAQLETLFGDRPSVIAEGIRGLVCVPLRALERTQGVIYADSSKPGAVFDELDVDILEALTSHAALAIAVSRIDRDLRGLVSTLPGRGGLSPEAGDSLGRELRGVIARSLVPDDPLEVRKRNQTTWTGLVHPRRSSGDSG